MAIESLSAEIADYRNRLENLEKRMDAIDRPVAELNKWRERSIGIIMSISAAAALIGSGLAFSWQKILDVFR